MEENQEPAEQAETPKSSNAMLIGGLVLVAIVIVSFLMLRGKSATPETPQPLTSNNSSTQTDSFVPTEDDSDTEALVEGANARTVTVEAGSFYFIPKEIRVNKGETVKIEMTAMDAMHDFTIDELDIKLPITSEGETSSVTFIADTVGEFEYYCAV